MDLFLQLSEIDKVLVESIPSDEIAEVSLFALEPSRMTSYYKIIGEQEIRALPEPYEQMCKAIGVKGIQALQTVPRQHLQAHLSAAVKGLNRILEDSSNVKYLKSYLKIRGFLDSLFKAAIDTDALKQLQQQTSHDTIRTALQTFMPAEDGYTKSVKYSMENTVTGRLTVSSGPQILTAPAEVRKCLQSKFSGGKVLQLDLVSAEPTMALHATGIEPPEDVYEHIAKSILGGKVTRKQAKLITLCALYGQSPARLRSKLPEGVEPNTVIRRTRKFFGFEKLVSQLRAKCSSGTIRSVMGRPISLSNNRDHTLVSYYLQSSAAEAAISMFSDFINETHLELFPLFMIHDALVIDCEYSAAQELQRMKELHVSLGEWKFRVAITQLSNN